MRTHTLLRSLLIIGLITAPLRAAESPSTFRIEEATIDGIQSAILRASSPQPRW
jgi:hypothetical protein